MPIKKESPFPSILQYNKPVGVTSFDALRPLKQILGTGKLGHTGTLDKFASGLMIILAGKALKLSSYFTHLDKHYEALVQFGSETDTLDPEGAVIASAPPPTCAAVQAVLPQFTGEIMQRPPVYSALHIDGKRAHSLARAGKAPQMPLRPVTIYALQLNAWTQVSDKEACAAISVHCSSGTYIRSLARDIARAAGSRAYLSALTRTCVGGFSLKDAFTPGDADTCALKAAFSPIGKSIFEKLAIPCFDVDEDTAAAMRHGKPLKELNWDAALEKAAIFCANPNAPPSFIALIEKKDTAWKYGFVI